MYPPRVGTPSVQLVPTGHRRLDHSPPGLIITKKKEISGFRSRVQDWVQDTYPPREGTPSVQLVPQPDVIERLPHLGCSTCKALRVQ